jgi:hypothetical protein
VKAVHNAKVLAGQLWTPATETDATGSEYVLRNTLVFRLELSHTAHYGIVPW